MNLSRVPALALAACLLYSQTQPPAAIADDTVVAESDGVKLTAGDISKLLQTLPPQMKINYERDAKGFLSQWFMLKKIVAFAEQQKLQEKSPYREGIEIARMQVLAQAAIEETTKTTVVPVEDQKKFYEAKKDDYTQARLKLIYIPFVTGQPKGSDPAKKTMTESEALAKAESMAKAARDGKDFITLVKENSEDPISKEKDGDFGPVKRGDRLPDNIKSAVFALKPGQISDPIRQPNGYYVFRLIELTAQPFEEIRETIHTELKNERVKKWLETTAKSAEVKMLRPEFFSGPKPQ